MVAKRVFQSSMFARVLYIRTYVVRFFSFLSLIFQYSLADLRLVSTKSFLPFSFFFVSFLSLLSCWLIPLPYCLVPFTHLSSFPTVAFSLFLFPYRYSSYFPLFVLDLYNWTLLLSLSFTPISAISPYILRVLTCYSLPFDLPFVFFPFPFVT